MHPLSGQMEADLSGMQSAHPCRESCVQPQHTAPPTKKYQMKSDGRIDPKGIPRSPLHPSSSEKLVQRSSVSRFAAGGLQMYRSEEVVL
eukprot:1460221-Rhodomonas_salina.1